MVFPLSGRTDWKTVKSLSGAVAKELVHAFPGEYVATMSKRPRRGKTFIDYLRNSRGATAIASYSTRARPGAPVATPLAWEEFTPALDRGPFTVEGIPGRLAALRRDPWDGFFTLEQTLTATALRAMKVKE